MIDDFASTTPRRAAQLITDLLGGDDKTEDALTRLAIQVRAGTASQGDYDTVQDALCDAFGVPRRRHKHPAIWKIQHWWHWHITDPIVYPLMEVPGALWWHCFRKWTGGTGTWIVSCRDGHLRVLEMTWYEHRRHRKTCQHSIAGDVSEVGEKS